jgi:hypothetical protein
MAEKKTQKVNPKGSASKKTLKGTQKIPSTKLMYKI